MFSGRRRLILPYRISVSIRFVEVKDGLCGAHDADDGVLEGQATLQVDVVGGAQWPSALNSMEAPCTKVPAAMMILSA